MFAKAKTKSVEPLWSEWFDGKTFTTDRSSSAFPTWVVHRSQNERGEASRPKLEVGVWEGRATIFLSQLFQARASIRFSLGVGTNAG